LKIAAALPLKNKVKDEEHEIALDHNRELQLILEYIGF